MFDDFTMRRALAAAFLAAGFAGLAGATTLNRKADQQLLGSIANASLGNAMTAQGDFNGDGIPDLVVSSSGGPDMHGAIDIFYGTRQGLSTVAAFHYEVAEASAQLGASPIVADVNGDGLPDLIVGAYNLSSPNVQYAGAVLLFLGKPGGGLDATPSQVLYGPSSNSFFGFGIRSLGDFDHDGHADIVVSAIGANNSVGALYVFRGGPNGLEPQPVSTLVGAPPWLYFGRVFDTGDLDGDGIADILVGASSPVGGIPGMAWVYHGTPTGYANVKAETLFAPLTLPDSALFGDSVAILGDVDGDGHADVAVGAPAYVPDLKNSGLIAVFYGSASGLATSGRSQVLQAGTPRMAAFGGLMLGQRDVNRDGYADLVVGTPSSTRPPSDSDPFPGAIWIYRGGPGGLDTEKVYKIFGTPGSRDELGLTLEVGDVNGDGVPDLLTGSGTYTGDLHWQGVVRYFRGVLPKRP